MASLYPSISVLSSINRPDFLFLVVYLKSPILLSSRRDVTELIQSPYSMLGPQQRFITPRSPSWIYLSLQKFLMVQTMWSIGCKESQNLMEEAYAVLGRLFQEKVSGSCSFIAFRSLFHTYQSVISTLEYTQGNNEKVNLKTFIFIFD